VSDKQHEVDQLVLIDHVRLKNKTQTLPGLSRAVYNFSFCVENKWKEN
jgi:hypothetical protein